MIKSNCFRSVNSGERKNTIATPLVADAYKLHKFMFRHLYPYPFEIRIKNEIISIKVDRVLKLKYVPFLLNEILITVIIGLGSCVFLPLLKLFIPTAKPDALVLVICVFLGSCAILEWGIYVLTNSILLINP